MASLSTVTGSQDDYQAQVIWILGASDRGKHRGMWQDITYLEGWYDPLPRVQQGFVVPKMPLPAYNDHFALFTPFPLLAAVLQQCF